LAPRDRCARARLARRPACLAPTHAAGPAWPLAAAGMSRTSNPIHVQHRARL
jgi:hypothetical protein